MIGKTCKYKLGNTVLLCTIRNLSEFEGLKLVGIQTAYSDEVIWVNYESIYEIS
jgi:hypothetical protein